MTHKAAMGKSRNKAAQEEDYAFVVDLRTVLAMRPEQRVKWLGKVCRKVADGEASVKHVYDVLSNRKLTTDMTEKVGRRMLRVLRENLYLFSEKQQRFLGEESTLAKFAVEERSEEEPEPDRDEQKPAARDEAAARMEEMMARCRDFVRQKASTFEDRQREVQEAEEAARLQREREAQEKLAREWDEIHRWHLQHLDWERAQMTALDERSQVREVEAAAAAVAAAAAGVPASSERSKTRDRSRHSSSSGGGSSSTQRRRDKKRSAPSGSGTSRAVVAKRDRDRDRDKGRRRHSSSSSSRRPPERRRFAEAKR